VTVKGIDVAWARPSVAQIKGVGAQFVCRYFSGDPKKNLHADEVTAYHAAGLGTVVVWETTAGRATAGKAAGVADAKAAEVQRKAVGLPADMVLHFAVDVDTSWSSVQAYFDGVISVLGLARTGCYGGVKVINGAYGHGIRFLWQTVAWSGGVWSVHATIQQRGGTVLGGSADLDYATVTDYGQYPRPNTPQEPPVTPAEIAAVADAVAAKLIAGGGVLENSDVDRVVKGVLSTDGIIAAPADAPDAKTNPFWALQSYIKDTNAKVRAIQATEAAQGAVIAKLAETVATLASNTAAIDPAKLVADIQSAIDNVVIHLATN
jgi:hypothetical protein